MIVFELQCANGHIFEGWFEDGNDYHRQKEEGLLNCPVCENNDVFKVLSPFAIKKTSPSAEKCLEKQAPLADLSAEIGKKVSEFIENNFDDVGCDFAKEALKIHYGVSESKNIRGVSTAEEDKMLQKEGVNFVKIAMPAKYDPDSDA